MKHKHAELMMQYAQDAMETIEPWRNWEAYNTHDRKWNDCSNHHKWYKEIKYRRKPKMVSVTLMSGEVVSFPEPHMRDYFAAMAMQGLISTCRNESYESTAITAYRMADTMLNEREK